MIVANERLWLGQVPVDVLTFEEAISRIAALAHAAKADGRGRLVYTPNVDHVVIAEDDARFREAYARADLCLADGFPLIVTSKLTKLPLPEKISGSDITLPVLERCARDGLRVYFLGAGPGVADLAKTKVEAMFPAIQIVGTSSPKVDVDGPRAARDEIVRTLREAKPDVVFLALGAPKQEIFAAQLVDEVPAVFVGVGATLDFIAGTVKRAKPWMSKMGLEWLYRLTQEPKRLFHRYVIRDSRYPAIVIRHALRSRRSR